VQTTLGIAKHVLAFLAFLPLTTMAQETGRRVSLNEALTLFAENSLALAIGRAEAAEAAGWARQLRAYPNPSFTLVNEDLSSEGAGYRETIYGLQQQIEWPGRTVARGRAANDLTAAAEAGFRSDSVRLAFDVREAYADAWAAEERERAVAVAGEVIGRVADAAERRLEEGDISGYEARRLRLERVGVENELALAELESSAARRRLAALVMPPDLVAEVGPAEALEGMPPSVSLESALAAAATRPDIQAASLAFDAAREERSVASSGWVPDPTLGLGYKDQSDGYTGAALTLSVPIPLFDRRGGAQDAARARESAAGAGLGLRERQARSDVLATFARYESARRRLARVGSDLLGEAEGLRVAAEAAYAEGEMTFLEMLDATRAFRDARLTAATLRADTWIAYYDLLRAMGRAPEEDR
jgi:cobalt-zinc-cadmium efflux system outer membrane protein